MSNKYSSPIVPPAQFPLAEGPLSQGPLAQGSPALPAVPVILPPTSNDAASELSRQQESVEDGDAVQEDQSPGTKAQELPREEFVAETERSEKATEKITVPTTRVWGVDFARVDMIGTVRLCDAIVQSRTPSYLVTANLNYLMLMDEHPRLADVNEHAAGVVADGHPIVLRSRLTQHPLPCRVAGSDLIGELATLSAMRGYRIFFLGGAPGVAQSAAATLQSTNPNLQIAGCYSPPFRKLSEAEHQAMLQRVRDARTDILLVAFGQPKGELWILDHLHELKVPLSIQLGASFDFLAGTAKRAPRCWQRLGLEWFYRAASDPRRLVPRYSRNIAFLLRLLISGK